MIIEKNVIERETKFEDSVKEEKSCADCANAVICKFSEQYLQTTNDIRAKLNLDILEVTFKCKYWHS